MPILLLRVGYRNEHRDGKKSNRVRRVRVRVRRGRWEVTDVGISGFGHISAVIM